jgi:hypothetical protein
MMNLKLVSRPISLSHVLATALFLLGGRRTTRAEHLQGAPRSPESDNEAGPTWPPPEGMYWGM